MEKAAIKLRWLKSLTYFASDDDNRKYLQGVCIEVGFDGVTYVACDGVQLMTIRHELREDEERNSIEGTFIVPTAEAKGFKLENGDEGLATLSLARGGEHDRLRISWGSKEAGEKELVFPPIDGTFPDWRRALPPAICSDTVAQFDLDRLDHIRRFRKDMSLTPPRLIHNGAGPAWVQFPGLPHIVGVLMPIKTTEDRIAVTGWLRYGPPRDQGDLEDVREREVRQLEDAAAKVDAVDNEENVLDLGDGYATLASATKKAKESVH